MGQTTQAIPGCVYGPIRGPLSVAGGLQAMLGTYWRSGQCLLGEWLKDQHFVTRNLLHGLYRVGRGLANMLTVISGVQGQ